MDKIYSRKRFKIGIKYKILISILLIIILIVVTLNNVIYPLFSKKCIYKAQVLVTQIANEETEKIMKNYTYKDLIHIEEDTEGNVTFLGSNVVLINQIKSEIMTKIQNRFLEIKDTNIEIKVIFKCRPKNKNKSNSIWNNKQLTRNRVLFSWS